MPALRRLRDPYIAFCGAAIALWLVAWAVASDNLYGWLVDDWDTFARFQRYALGGQQLYDIPWFHAYMWFLMYIPWQLHWTLPSHAAPRAWEAMGQFRALIMYTIALHAVVIGLLAGFIRQLCSNRIVAAAAFLLILTSPTLTLYAPLLDSRYLGLLAALPALMLLIHAARRELPPSAGTYALEYFLPGLLLGIAEDIHYECLYLVVPFSLVYWVLLLVAEPRSRRVWAAFACFCGGLLSWIVPIQLLSLLFQPFSGSYIGTMLAQYAKQIPPYSHLENLSAWLAIYLSEMGIPMILAVIGGVIVCSSKRLRPDYISALCACLMVGSSFLFALYILWSQTFPFYRMSFGLQFFYAIFAVAFIERVTYWVVRRSVTARVLTGSLLFVVIAFIPTFLRSTEVYAAQQGYGKAVNFAYQMARGSRVRFIAAVDMDLRPDAIISREQFDSMSDTDYLVTYFPETFHFKYPDLFALMFNTHPVATYPTLWCTKEMWAQVPTFYGTRRWSDEPANCDVHVFRVRDLRSAARGPRLDIAWVGADSIALPGLNASRVFDLREPSMLWYGSELWNPYWDLWVSKAYPGEHELGVRLVRPVKLSRITVVPAEFRVPPDFLWHGRKRVENMRIYGGLKATDMRLLWTGEHLENDPIFSADFTPTPVSRLRFVMWQGPGPNPAVGIKYLDFPGFEQRTLWPNHDTPGRPSPGR